MKFKKLEAILFSVIFSGLVLGVTGFKMKNDELYGLGLGTMAGAYASLIVSNDIRDRKISNSQSYSNKDSDNQPYS